MMKKLAAVLIPLVLVGMAACKSQPPPPPPPTPVPATPTPPPPPSVGMLTLGNAIGADKKVTAASDTFHAKDTIYASVETAGVGPTKLRALWTFVKGEKTAKVDESTMEFDASGPATNEFHIAKPSGWPKGDYRVEVFLNDGASPAMTKTFKVS
jgi:hypothetical protein